MLKLVVLSEGLSGRAFEIKAEKTTIGRVEDNTFQLSEPSVSSHHAEVWLNGADVMVKDLDSTNGTYINGEKIAESKLKPGQTLRFGSVDLKLDAPGQPSAPPPAKKPSDKAATQGGVKMTTFEPGCSSRFAAPRRHGAASRPNPPEHLDSLPSSLDGDFTVNP